jgi:thiol-disulfide isomerase/thioredoxin
MALATARAQTSAEAANGALDGKLPALRTPAGAPQTLAAYRGRVVLLNFWATWCAPCREEMPELNRLDATLDHRRAAVVGIAADEPAEVQSFLGKLKVQYPNLVGAPDPVYAWSAQLGNQAMGLPFSVLLDRQGKVRWMKSGGKLTQREVHAEMVKLLGP